MSPVDLHALATALRFPRVSGDEPVAAITEPREGEFSPRERG